MIKLVFKEPRVLVRKGRKRKVTRTYKKLFALSNQMSKAVQVDLVKGIKTFRKRVSSEALHTAWKTGEYSKVLRQIPWEKFPVDLEPAYSKIRDTAFKSTAQTIAQLPPPVKSGLRFDTKNPLIRSYLHKRTGELVTLISHDTQKVIQNAVIRSFNEALTPKQVSSMIRDSIGLLPQHEVAVFNFRNALEKKGESPDRVDELVGNYQDRLLDYRANMIARTETRMATNQGELSVWKEAANQGYFDTNTANKIWIVDGDPCEICEPMDGVSVPLYQSWTLNNGDVVDIPTESHPHCMCGMELSFGEAVQGEFEE